MSTDTWTNWTGDVYPADALLSEPMNDWNLVTAILPALNPPDPHILHGINATDSASLISLLDGLTVFSNSVPSAQPLVIDKNINSNALAQIITGINRVKAAEPSQVFTNLTQILTVPELSVASPFLDPINQALLFTTDIEYECLPSQLLFLLRLDSIGSLVVTKSQSQVQFTGMDGNGYLLQSSTNLLDWTSIGTFYPTNGIISYSRQNAAGSPTCYYRTVLAP